MDIDKMQSITGLAMELAEKHKPDEIEIYLDHEKSTSVDIQNGKIAASNRTVDAGLGVRLAYGKRVGVGFTTSLEERDLKEVIASVARTAMRTAEKDTFAGFPVKSGTPTKQQLHFLGLLEIPVEEVAEITNQLLAGCKVDGVTDPVVPFFGRTELYEGGSIILNSHGVKAINQVSFFISSMAIVAIRGGRSGPMVQDFFISRDKVIDDPEGFAKSVARLAYDVAAPEKPKLPDTIPVVFHPFGISPLFGNIFYPSIRADVKQQGNSFLGDRLGEELVPANFELYDDGTHPTCVNTSYFDAEGVAKQRTAVFEKGVFKSFLYDYTTAQKEGIESTGNAGRSDATGVNPGGYANVPRVVNTNTVIKTGKGDLDSLISDISLGLFIHGVQGAHQGSPETGEFTGVANPAFVIRNGELAEPVAGYGIAGNMLDLFKEFEAATGTARSIGSGWFPYLKFRKLRIVSQPE